MKVVQATYGVFHQFELARELLRRGLLERIYSTFPWQRLKREEVPHDRVETYPWVNTPFIVLEGYGLLTPALSQFLKRHNALTFDRWVAARIPECDALISLCGSSLAAGRLVQARGGTFYCDCGSTHRRFQAEMVAEEYCIWKLPHTPEDERSIERDETIFAEADAIVVPSRVARQTFLDRGISPEKIHTIPYGVLLDRFRPTGEPRSGQNATFEVLFVGGVNLRKGIPYLLLGFAGLKHPRKRLRIVGAIDPAIKPLLATLSQTGVEFLGPIPQAQLPAIMSASHVMVLPSVEDGLALVQGQALACGCPVIATVATGAEDLFTDGIEGFILPIRTPQAIADRLQLLADDPTLRARMSAAALARVRDLGGWQQYGDRWQALLEIDKKGPAGQAPARR